MTDATHHINVASQNEIHRQQTTLSQKCPQCGADVPVHTGYVSWSDQCKWNLQSTDNDKPHSLFETLYLKLGKRLSKQQFEQFAKAPALKASITPTKVAAVLTAILVHCLTLFLFVLGVTIVIVTGLSASLLFAAIFIGMAWLMRPRFSKMPPADDILRRDEHPALYGLTDRIAKELGAPRVETIVLDGDFNASFGRAGWRRKDVLTIGLPLFEILGPQERVALLAHEIGHGVNGDPTRGFLVGWALYALNQWYRVLPSPGHRASRTNQLAFGTYIANILMIPFAQIPRLWLEVLAFLMFRDSQRAEYLADHLAAETAGTEGQLGLLRKLHMTGTVGTTIRRFYLNSSKGNLFGAIKLQIANVPQRELERIDQVERLIESRLDSMHPPTAYRIDLLKARDIREPRVMLSEEDNHAIDAELAIIEPSEQSKILTMVDSGFYYGNR